MYLFRDDAGQVLYVGKSISIRSRARAHFAPSAPPAKWTAHAAVVDYRTTRSELGALVLENRLIKELAPPGNKRLTRRDDRLVYIRCRLDIPYPILEVSPQPAAGHAVTIGPVHGRRLALELVEQLDSLFGLRHCGRRLPRRQHPSAYGQMGRCLSPCLGDLDPNLYRRRLDEALRLFVCDRRRRSPGRLLDHVERQMRRAAAEQRYERAAALRRRRRGSARSSSGSAGCSKRPTRVRDCCSACIRGEPTSTASGSPGAGWSTGGRSAPVDLDRARAPGRRGPASPARPGDLGTHLPPDEIDEMRIVAAYLASHPDTPQLVLDPAPETAALAAFLAGLSARTEARRLRPDLVDADGDRLRQPEPRGARARARSARGDGETATLAEPADGPPVERDLVAGLRPGSVSRRPRRWRLGLPR